MKILRHPILIVLSVILLAACAKEEPTTAETNPVSENLLPNIEEDPNLLLGSWNLTTVNSASDTQTIGTACEATNIHFLEDNAFYLNYLDKRIKGSYEIIDSVSINLSSGTNLIGSVNQVMVDGNTLNLSIDIDGACASTYNGERYFRIHQFIWESLNELYLWQEEVPALNNSNAPGSAAYSQLIQPYPEPESFFESLKHEDDKYSIIQSNYVDLENSIKGIDANNGVNFILSRYGGDDDILGVVTYILPESDAADKDIQRGDVFIGVNGQSLNMSNYRALLYGDNLDYTLNMADINNNVISSNGKNIPLTKTENFQSNPIHIHKVIELGGSKVGYLMYNQFADGFDNALNDVFADFKTEQVNEVVIDLRYNGGGLTRSAVNLAGMITGQFDGQVFSKYIWNTKLMEFLNQNKESYASWLGENFTNVLRDGTAINSLNLNRVYVITSNRSASSSELVINGLAPYIDVVQVGDNTYGKNVGGPSAVYDYIDNNRTKNPDHTYAMYPMTFFSANNQDFYDYADGLSPQQDLLLKEDLTNLGVLGDVTEPLLSLALNHISGNTAARSDFSYPNFPLENTVDDPHFLRDQLITSLKEFSLIDLD